MVRTHQAERSFVGCGIAEGGHGPFRGLDAPFALEPSYAKFGFEVNLAANQAEAELDSLNSA
jgi:hypothetical protein